MRETESFLEQAKNSALAQYESGTAPQTDVLRANIELAELKNEITTMERERDVAQASIHALLNEAPTAPRHNAGTLKLPKLVVSVEKLFAMAKNRCFILMSTQRMKEAKEAMLKAVRLEGKPDLEFRVEARQFEESGSIDEYDTGIFLNIPWLWRGKYGAKVREAQAELNAAQADLESEINQTFVEIREKHARADESRRQIQLYKKTILPQARQLVESSRASYQVNRATLLELLDAERMLRESTVRYFGFQADYVKNCAELDQITAPWGTFETDTGLVSAMEEEREP